jgi:outer membrane protein insertion porin family
MGHGVERSKRFLTLNLACGANMGKTNPTFAGCARATTNRIGLSMPMKAKKNLLSAVAAVALIVSASPVFAAFSSIEVRGNQRVEASTIRDYIGVKPGAPFGAGDIDEAVKRLFSTGLFSDVRIRQSGSVLIVEVDELSVVNQVIFQGNRKIKDVALSNQVQMKPRAALDQNVIEQDAETIRQAYRRIGRADVVVEPTTMDLGNNRVNVVYNITEGDRTKIATINFVGNNAYGDRRLQEVISTKRSNFMSWLSRNDVYDEDKLRADEELLRRFYFNKGYADFQVLSSTAELDEATNKYTITVTVDEGERYTFGDITVESTVEGLDGTALQNSIETRTGRTYSAKDVEDSLIAVSERVAGKGYAFAQVTPRGDRDVANRTISIVYTVDQGQKAYVERIDIRGNDKTRDYVIRREFDLSEGDAFNQVMIQRAKRRLERLGFFEKVEIATAPGTEPDQVVLIVDVVEKSTGEFSIGAGYSTGGENSGASLEGSVTERNFLGRGQYLKLSLGGTSDSRTYTLSFTEPYFLGYRIAAGFDIYKNTNNYDGYDLDRTGGTVRFGLPIMEKLSAQVAYNLVSDDYLGKGANGAKDASYPTFIPDPGPWVKSSVSGTLVWDSIDDKNNPREGIFSRFTTEVAGLGGDAKWVKSTIKGSYYQTISEDLSLVGILTAGAGHVFALGSPTTPSNADGGILVGDLFRANSDIVRGFKNNGFGPTYDNAASASNGSFIGGTTYLNASAEMQFPMPILPESIGIKGAVFADVGTLFGTPYTSEVANDAMAFRSSVGASLIWASPFGPLRVDYAVPVMKEAQDKVQNFNFGISTKF